MRLVADRFAQEDNAADGRAVDLATGRAVMLVVGSAGGVSEQARWAIRCDALQRLHHVALARLIDFGIVGQCSRFEAWSCGRLWAGSAVQTRVVGERARAFLRANGLASGSDTAHRVHGSARGAVMLPDAEAGYPVPVTISVDVTVDSCGLATIARPAVSALSDMFGVTPTPRPHVATLWGPPGSGRRTAVLELARIARLHGFIPVAASLLETRLADVCRGRSLFIIDEQERGPARSSERGWARLLRAAAGSAQPQTLLMVGIEETRGVDGVALARVDAESLLAAVRPALRAPGLEQVIRRAAQRAQGLPGRFAQLLWPTVDRHAPGSVGPARRAAERVAVYGEDAEAAVLIDTLTVAPLPTAPSSWPAPGELAGLRRRMESALHDLRHGRHAPGIRQLRQAIGGLARRADWVDATAGSIALAECLLGRGRPRDVHAALDSAREYAERAGDASKLIDIATLQGVAWVDRARLDEAESVLSAAAAAARAANDTTRLARANEALARGLFWRGEYADAEVTLGAMPDDASMAIAVRHASLASRIAVGRRDVRRAMALAGTAGDCARAGGPADRAAAACAAAFVHLAVNDFDAVERDTSEGIAAARVAHDPLRALRARLLRAEAERRRGRTAAALAQLTRLKRIAATVPPIVRSRWELLTALASGLDTNEAVRRQAAASGLGALTLFAPVRLEESSHAVGDGAADAVIAILRACQLAEDEIVVLKEVCACVRRELHAASVSFVAPLAPVASVALATGRLGHTDTIAGDGERLSGADQHGIALRALDAGVTIAPHRRDERTEAAAPVQYGGTLIGVLCARWAVGSISDLSRASAVLTTAAAAAAPVLSAALARRRTAVPVPLTDLVGVTPAMADLRAAIGRAAAAPFAVLIAGESGSGKELVARGVHRMGPRRDRAFCTLNCAALPDDLVESELFGHARGSFTGAVTDRPGVFEEAHGGTLFLDEIGELSLRAQAKILRVVQEGELRRVGENVSRRVDVRIIAATNRDLHQEVGAGRFRLDLLYRLDVVRLMVPPLRERREDIAVIAEHVWRDATARVGSRATLSAAVVAALARYDWPGNVRELQNVLASLAVRTPKRGVVPPTALPVVFGASADVETWRLEAARRTFEERFVRAALVRSGGHRSRAAAELGVSRQGLTKLMSRLGIDEQRPTNDQ